MEVQPDITLYTIRGGSRVLGNHYTLTLPDHRQLGLRCDETAMGVCHDGLGAAFSDWTIAYVGMMHYPARLIVQRFTFNTCSVLND